MIAVINTKNQSLLVANFSSGRVLYGMFRKNRNTSAETNRGLVMIWKLTFRKTNLPNTVEPPQKNAAPSASKTPCIFELSVKPVGCKFGNDTVYAPKIATTVQSQKFFDKVSFRIHAASPIAIRGCNFCNRIATVGFR